MWQVQEVVPVDRSAHRAGVRAALVVLVALVALLGTHTGAGAVAASGAGPSPASAPADPSGSGQQDVCEADRTPPVRAERRSTRTCRPATVDDTPGTVSHPSAPCPPAPSTRPGSLPATRSPVLRC
jgi:hypothetical protein